MSLCGANVAASHRRQLGAPLSEHVCGPQNYKASRQQIVSLSPFFKGSDASMDEKRALGDGFGVPDTLGRVDVVTFRADVSLMYGHHSYENTQFCDELSPIPVNIPRFGSFAKPPMGHPWAAHGHFMNYP